MCSPPRAWRSGHKVMFTFSCLLVGGKLSGGGLQNEWVAQGLLLDSSNPELTGLRCYKCVYLCAHLCVCVFLWCVLALRGLLFCQRREELENVRMFPKSTPNICLWFSCNWLHVAKSLNRKCWQVYHMPYGAAGALFAQLKRVMWANSSQNVLSNLMQQL